MKKLIRLLALAVWSFALTGCDPSTFLHYRIKNSTSSDVTIKIGGAEPTTISSGAIMTVYDDSVLGEFTSDPFSGDRVVPYTLTVLVNDEPVTGDFWLKKYWELKSTDKHQLTYTMILTDELIETLLSEK
jgi:hypothetical protein